MIDYTTHFRKHIDTLDSLHTHLRSFAPAHIAPSDECQFLAVPSAFHSDDSPARCKRVDSSHTRGHGIDQTPRGAPACRQVDAAITDDTNVGRQQQTKLRGGH